MSNEIVRLTQQQRNMEEEMLALKMENMRLKEMIHHQPKNNFLELQGNNNNLSNLNNNNNMSIFDQIDPNRALNTNYLDRIMVVYDLTKKPPIIVSATQSFCKLLGYNREDVLNQPWHKFISMDSLENTTRRLRNNSQPILFMPQLYFRRDRLVLHSHDIHTFFFDSFDNPILDLVVLNPLYTSNGSNNPTNLNNFNNSLASSSITPSLLNSPSSSSSTSNYLSTTNNPNNFKSYNNFNNNNFNNFNHNGNNNNFNNNNRNNNNNFSNFNSPNLNSTNNNNFNDINSPHVSSPSSPFFELDSPSLDDILQSNFGNNENNTNSNNLNTNSTSNQIIPHRSQPLNIPFNSYNQNNMSNLNNNMNNLRINNTTNTNNTNNTTNTNNTNNINPNNFLNFGNSPTHSNLPNNNFNSPIHPNNSNHNNVSNPVNNNLNNVDLKDPFFDPSLYLEENLFSPFDDNILNNNEPFSFDLGEDKDNEFTLESVETRPLNKK